MSARQGLGVREIRSVVLPVGPRYLLLPNSAVAELIGYRPPRPMVSGADWLLGEVTWRARQIPVMSLERALGLPADIEHATRARIAVLNTLNGNPALPYIGLLTLGIARLIRVSSNALQPDDADATDSGLIHASVTIQGQPAWIPDLDAFEHQVEAAVGGG